VSGSEKVNKKSTMKILFACLCDHVHNFCHAQAQFQLSWADLALFLIHPAARPDILQSRPELAGNQINLIRNIGRKDDLQEEDIKEDDFEELEIS
jgi:hypothetical protein